MPKRTDIKRILVIGSGPIVIGQACEFDYSGAQACKVLKEDGYEVVLVNSNPATIMTDPQLVDRTYVEPITKEFIEKIIEKERPDALLPTLGGQTALNAAVELAKSGVLDKFGVEMIGCDLAAIERGEDRKQFNEAMAEIGLEVARSGYAYSVDDALGLADMLDDAGIHDSDTVGDRHGFLLVVRDIHGGDTNIVLDVLDDRAHLNAQLRVKVAQRLVHQQDARLNDECARQRDALLLAAGELRRALLLEAIQAESAQLLGHAGGALLLAGAKDAHADVLLDGHVGEELVVLEEVAHAALLRAEVHAGRRVKEHTVVEDDAALVGRDDARDALERH